MMTTMIIMIKMIRVRMMRIMRMKRIIRIGFKIKFLISDDLASLSIEAEAISSGGAQGVSSAEAQDVLSFAKECRSCVKAGGVSSIWCEKCI